MDHLYIHSRVCVPFKQKVHMHACMHARGRYEEIAILDRKYVQSLLSRVEIAFPSIKKASLWRFFLPYYKLYGIFFIFFLSRIFSGICVHAFGLYLQPRCEAVRTHVLGSSSSSAASTHAPQSSPHVWLNVRKRHFLFFKKRLLHKKLFTPFFLESRQMTCWKLVFSLVF